MDFIYFIDNMIFSLFFVFAFYVSGVSVIMLADEALKGYLRISTKWKQIEIRHYLLLIGSVFAPISVLIYLGVFK